MVVINNTGYIPEGGVDRDQQVVLEQHADCPSKRVLHPVHEALAGSQKVFPALKILASIRPVEEVRLTVILISVALSAATHSIGSWQYL